MKVYTYHYHTKPSDQGRVSIYATAALRDDAVRDLMVEFSRQLAERAGEDVAAAEPLNSLLEAGEIEKAPQLWGKVFDHNEFFVLKETEVMGLPELEIFTLVRGDDKGDDIIGAYWSKDAATEGAREYEHENALDEKLELAWRDVGNGDCWEAEGETCRYAITGPVIVPALLPNRETVA